MANADKEKRRLAMVEAGWIIMEALTRAVKEYNLSHAELTEIVCRELGGWAKEQIKQEWGEQ